MAKLTPCRERGLGAGGWGLAAERSRRLVQSSGCAAGCRAAYGDEAAASHLAGDEAFGFEEFVGGGDGGTVQAK